MKKILFSLLILFLTILSVQADELLSMPYKNIKDAGKIKNIDGIWTNKVSGREKDYIIKFDSEDDGFAEFYDSNGTIYFKTDCKYMFVHNGSLIGYSEYDLRFYEYILNGTEVDCRALYEEELTELFPNFRIIRLSDFSNGTHSLKIKKDRSVLQVLLLNDTDINYENYEFSSENGKFDRYIISGLIKIYKKGMYQFSHYGENTTNKPWYILLVR